MRNKIHRLIKNRKKRSESAKLNWLRAAVLGANDGIVSIAGLLAGVAGATTNRHTLLVAGMAGILAGALSMAAGEFVSVSTQRDAEMKGHQDCNHEEQHDFTNPWDAAIASALSFSAGAAIPMLAIVLSSESARITALFVSVPLALAVNGFLSAKATGTSARKAVIRVIIGGLIAMLATYFVGRFIGPNI